MQIQIGGGRCTLCKSPGTNKSTCPLNPQAKKPNPAKHNVGAQESADSTRQQDRMTIPLPSTKSSMSQTPKDDQASIITCRTNPEGMEILNKVALQLDSISLLDIGIYYEEGDEHEPFDEKAWHDMAEEDRERFMDPTLGRNLTKQELNTPFAFCKEVKVDFLSGYDEDEEFLTITKTIKTKKDYISVQDIVEAFLKNNKELADNIRRDFGLGPDERVELGNHIYFEGITEIAPGHYSMTSFGS